MTYWIDQQAYFTLKTAGWDIDGNELKDGGFTSFEIDAAIDPVVFTFAPPEGAQILDTRIAGVDELNALWKQAAQQALFNVYRPTHWLSDAREGRPYYDEAQGMLTQAFPRANSRDPNAFEIQVPVITQRRAANKDTTGTGPPVKVGNLTGIYASNESIQTLTVVRDGTEITLSLPLVQGGRDMLGRMIQILDSLELVQK
jgi:hypothetical protein